MTGTSVVLAILALVATSVLVRIGPVFLRSKVNESTRGLLERFLPTAVFLNFAVYIVYTEVRLAPLPAVVACSAVAALAFRTRAGLIVTACAASVLYGAVLLATKA